MHAYRGVFGSHVADVIRRLKRVAAFYGAKPVFILCSATIGNPAELASSLVEEDVVAITNNGAPPKAKIKEGGGLSSLRRRIEKAGGTVTVHSLPVFVLEVTLPDKGSTYDTRYDR
jgi:Lhr-like helicase